jgi:pimeloyl-ACP methyl ester carboxylesterase
MKTAQLHAQLSTERLAFRWVGPTDHDKRGEHIGPLVFLHEGLGSVSMWRDWPHALCLSLGLPGLVFSRRGYGDSSPVEDVRGPARLEMGIRKGRLNPDYMHIEAHETLAALLKALGISAPILVGHSDGGTIALLHASRFAVRACIVLAPHVMVEDISISAISQAKDAFLQGDLRTKLAKHHSDVDGAFWQWNDAWLNPAFRDYDIRDEIKGITAPLLAIQGDDDPYGTQAQIDAVARSVGHAELLKLPHCGHSPHRDQTERVNQAIASFLRSNGLV